MCGGKVTWSALLFLSVSLGVFPQQEYRTDLFRVEFDRSEIRLTLPENEKITINKIWDVTTNAEVTFSEPDHNFYKFFHEEKGSILRIDMMREINSEPKQTSTYLATPSASTGDIKVYFNHTVDTSYRQSESAINLGNKLDDTLISYINRCEKTLDITIYNSYSPSPSSGIAGAINAAYARGVRVRVIYEGSTSSTMIGYLNAGIPRLPSPQTSAYGLMHNKFVVFDADHSDPNKPIVWTGSTNWTVAQIDGPDKNHAIIIQDQALARAFKLEFEEMWGDTGITYDTAKSKFGKYKSDNTPHNFLVGGKWIECYFSPSDGTNGKIISAINSGHSDINIATMLITRSDIATALVNKFNSGVQNINIVTDNQNPSGTQIPSLQADLLPNHVVLCPLSGQMHHKFMVVDNFNLNSDPLVVTGSHNWSTSAETKNDENTLIVHDALIADQFYQAFAWLYTQAGGEIMVGEENQSIEKDDFIVFPNPTSGILNFSEEGKTGLEFEIFDLAGKKHRVEFDLKPGIDLSFLPPGIYFLKVREQEEFRNFRIVKY